MCIEVTSTQGIKHIINVDDVRMVWPRNEGSVTIQFKHDMELLHISDDYEAIRKVIMEATK